MLTKPAFFPIHTMLLLVRHLSLVTALLLPFCLSSADSLVVSIPEGADRIGYEEIQQKQFILLDRDGKYSISQLLEDPAIPWEPQGPRTFEDDAYVGWSKTTFRNEGTTPRHDYLVFQTRAKNVRVYVVQKIGSETTVTEQEAQSLPGFDASIALYLAPGASSTVYFRGNYYNWNRTLEMFHTVLNRNTRINRLQVKHYSYYFLYLGLMLALVVFSSLLYFFFRQNSIIYLNILLLGFVGYFYYSFRVSGILPISYSWYVGPVQNLFVPIIYLGLSGFIINYLDLHKNFPKLYHWYQVASGLIVFFSIAALFTVFGTPMLIVILNVLVLFWTIFTISLVILAARKGGRSEFILLLSFGVLFLFGSALIVRIILDIRTVDARNLFLWSTLGLSAIIFFGVYDKLTAGIRENQRLTDQHQFRTRFFANVTHEFRTPLTLILGPIKQLLQRSTDPAEQQLLSIADRNARRQLHLINQILDLSRSEASRAILEASPVELVALLRRVTATYESFAAQKEISLTFITDLPVLVISAETAKLETILYNLLTNAFKFTPAGGSISVILEVKEGNALITVRDTGAGIPASALPHIFNRFYTDSTNAETPIDASGIGLALSRELVLLHGGTIEVSSEPDVRTDFRISLPYTPGSQLPSPADGVSESMPLYLDNFSGEEVEERVVSKQSKKLPLVLIVEDNADMRTYIRMGLEGQYRVRTAPNGREGVELARQLMPDLVVSDVMMPEMNGFELCLDLKTEITTSHIPVILLTARSASRDRLHGLDTGADDYLVKPFEVKELLARIRNLIRSRQMLRELFASSITLKPSEITATPVDQQFLTSAIQAVEDHIDDETFDIDQLAQHLAMSRTSLNRKFRALIDQSSNHFIRGVRLERAADLLLKTEDTVAIIADKTGFGSATYFIKSFREKFGKTPGAYRKDG